MRVMSLILAALAVTPRQSTERSYLVSPSPSTADARRKGASMNDRVSACASAALAAALLLSLTLPVLAEGECLEACPTLASGAWPVDLQSPVAGYPYTPTLYDADGDGAAEIFVTGGETFAIEGDGSFVPGWPTEEMPEAGYGTTGNLPGPSVANMDGAGDAEIAWSLRDWFAGSSQIWSFNARRFDGSDLPGFPREAPDPPSDALYTPIMLGDLDGDETQEVCGAHSLGGGLPNRLSCLDSQGSVLFTFDALPGDLIRSHHFGDIDGNGAPETFFFSYHLPTKLIRLYVLDASGALAPGYPKPLITIVGHPPLGPFVAWDADANGDLELFIAYGSSTPATVDCYHHTGSRCAGYPLEITALDSQVLYFTLGDLTGDGRPEILLAANDMVAEGDFSLHAADVVTGASLPGWPKLLQVQPTANPTCADVTNDGKQDFLVTLANGQIVGYSFTGAALPGFPLVMPTTAISGAAVGDIDGDGLFEIVAATWDGFVYAWDTVGQALPVRADWPMRGANSRNTGILYDREVVFRDGFEGGDTSAWSSVAP